AGLPVGVDADEHVLWLQIAVDHAAGVGIRKCAEDLVEKAIHRVAVRRTRTPISKRPARYELDRHVRPTIDGPEVEKPCDVRMLKTCDGTSFPRETAANLGLMEEVVADDLECRDVSARGTDPIDGAHSTAADRIDDAIGADVLRHRRGPELGH